MIIIFRAINILFNFYLELFRGMLFPIKGQYGALTYEVEHQLLKLQDAEPLVDSRSWAGKFAWASFKIKTIYL